MECITKEQFDQRPQHYLGVLRTTVFIYPTDTIYGIGCNALDEQLVQRIRELKGREEKPFSIIAPSKEWIRQHCVVDARAEHWLEQLPGPYTLILKLKNRHAVAAAVNGGAETIGVRIPAHWISDVVQKLDIPIVTTSANISGEKNMTSTEDLAPAIANGVSLLLYDGPLHGRPSTIVRLDTPETEIKERAR